MCIQKITNCVGLGFDIIGAILLYKFALKLFRKDSDGMYFFETTVSDLIKKHVRYTKAGIIFLIIGFCFQFLSNLF